MKKGFTLIELLSVLVILGIILVIAVPRVLDVIEISKKQAFELDVKNVIKTFDLKSMISPDPSNFIVTNNNMSDVLHMSDENYEFLELSSDIDNSYAIVAGKNAWEGLIICGTKENLAFFDDIEDCNRFVAEPVYTSEEITAKIALGYIPISTADELNNIRNNTSNTFGLNTEWENTYVGGLDKNYIQVKSINLGVEPYNTGEGWVPIGTHEYYCDVVEPVVGAFEGIYDGGGYKISNLYINRNITIYPVGLFSTSSGSFYNIIIDQSSVTSGYKNNMLNEWSYVRENEMPVGTLVGLVTGNNINIDNVKIQGNTKAITGVKSIWPTKIGSLIGYVQNVNIINITNTKAIGNVIGYSSFVGGLIGRVSKYNEILIENSSFDGKVIGGYKIAGLIGKAAYEKTSSDPSPWTNSVKLTIRNTIVNADITANEGMDIGGLVGQTKFLNDLLIENVTFNGNINYSFHNTGGLVGNVGRSNSLIIKDSNVNGNIVDNYSGRAGGVIGTIKEVSSVLLDNVHYIGNINTDRPSYHPPLRIGGLIGSVGIFWNTEDPMFYTLVNINNSSAKGDLIGATSKMGGLVGVIDRNDQKIVNSQLNINNSFYEGNIYTKTNSDLNQGRFLMLGGLVGAGVNININNSYAKSNIYGVFNSTRCKINLITEHAVGGLVGKIITNATITNSYYVGDIEVKYVDVVQNLNTYDYINAVVGDKDNATLTGVYYDSTVTSVQDTLAIPKTTINMKSGVPSLDIYTNWDTNIWNFDDTNAYPTFK